MFVKLHTIGQLFRYIISTGSSSLALESVQLFDSLILKYFNFISGVKQTSNFRRKILMDSFINTYLMKPHTVMGSFLYEGY